MIQAKKLFFLSLSLMLSFPLFSQEDFNQTIVVEGKSKINVTPVIVNFRVDFSEKDSSFIRCSDLAIQKIADIKSLFSENKIDTSLIKTINYSIREEKEFDEQQRKPVFVGYVATIPVNIKTEINNPNTALIFDLIKNNFDSNLNIFFELSDDQVAKIKKELIKLAVQDAKGKARELGKNLNIELGDIAKVQYGEPNLIGNLTRSNYDLSSSMKLEAMSSVANFNTLTPADIQMSTNVIIAWKIK